MDEIGAIAEIADKLGVMVLGVAFVIALYRKDIVFGWVHSECLDEVKRFRASAESRMAQMEAELIELRRSRQDHA
jgi:hypothetical protein